MYKPGSRIRDKTEEELWRGFESELEFNRSGINCFLVELVRRSQEKQTNTVIRLTKWITFLTVIVTAATMANLYFAWDLHHKQATDSLQNSKSEIARYLPQRVSKSAP